MNRNGQAFYDESDAYRALTDERPTLHLGRIEPGTPSAMWLLAKSGEWMSCLATCRELSSERVNYQLEIEGPPEAYAPGTSGSPILTGSGRAIALVSVGHVMNPLLRECLPARLRTRRLQPLVPPPD